MGVVIFGREEGVDLLELGATEGGLEVGEAVVEADFAMDVFVAREFGLGGEVFDVLGEAFVASDGHAAAAGGDEFIAVKTEAPDIAEGADGAAADGGTEALSGVLDDFEMVRVGDFHEAVHVDGVTEDVDGENGRDAAVSVPIDEPVGGAVTVVGEEGVDGVEIHLPMVGFGVDENGPCADVANGVGRSDEGEARDEDFVVGLNADGDKGEVKSGCAGTDGNGARSAETLSELRLESINE